MDIGARRGEAERPGANRRFAQLRHLLDLVGSRNRFDVGAAIAHHIGAQRGVGHLGADVDRPTHRVEQVEVLGERLPAPCHAFAQRGTGDVLDAFEQFDQELVLVGPDRGEPDAAVAEQDRGDPVDRRGRDVGVPGDLAVVVGVDVDPARRDDHPGGVDFSYSGSDVVAGRLDGDDRFAVDCDVGQSSVGTCPVDHRAIANHQVVHG